MPKAVPIETLQRLVIAGPQAGLSFEYMISLLRGGFSPEQVLRLVESEWLDPKAEQMPRRIMWGHDVPPLQLKAAMLDHV